MTKPHVHLAQFLCHGPTYHSLAMWRHPRIAAEEFVDLVVPELQRRGRFRRDYAGTTQREHLMQERRQQGQGRV